MRNMGRLRPRYNLGPQGFVPVVRSTARGGGGGGGPQGAVGEQPSVEREVCAMKWGLVPSFAKRPEDYDVFKGGSSTFNARVETLDTSGIWRRLVDSQRAVVLFDGFYEWKTVGKGKVPMYIRNKDEFDGHVIPPSAGSQDGSPTPPSQDKADRTQPASEAVLPLQEASQATTTDTEGHGESGRGGGPASAPLMLAALYDCWRSKEDKMKGVGAGADGDSETDGLESVTLVTMDSDGTPVAKVHDRMPLFLTPETAAMWLDPSVSFSKAIKPVAAAAQEHARQQLLMYEVSTLVSNVKSESPDCNLPKAEVDKKQFARGLGKFFTKATPKATSVAAAVPASEPVQTESRKRLAEPAPEGGHVGLDGEGTSVQMPPTKAARVFPVQASKAAQESVVIDLDD